MNMCSNVYVQRCKQGTFNASCFCTIKRVESFAVPNGRERIVIVKLVIKFMWVRLRWRPMLLAVIICVTAFRAERGKKCVNVLKRPLCSV